MHGDHTQLPRVLYVGIFLSFVLLASAPDAISASTELASTSAIAAPTSASPSTAASAGRALPLTVIDGTSDNNNGSGPSVSSGILRTSLNAGAQSGRSEVMWGDESKNRLLFLEGDRVTVNFDVRPNICGPGGELPADRSTWHVVYQLHGALKDNSWASGPSVSLIWQRGLWFMRGGYSVKQSNGASVSQESESPHPPAAPCGVWQHWTIDQRVGGPGSGSVDAWLDGEKVVDGWKPNAGTMYTNSGIYSHAALQIKNGIYAGGYTPWQRTMEHRNITIMRSRNGEQKIWSTAPSSVARSNASPTSPPSTAAADVTSPALTDPIPLETRTVSPSSTVQATEQTNPNENASSIPIKRAGSRSVSPVLVASGLVIFLCALVGINRAGVMKYSRFFR